MIEVGAASRVITGELGAFIQGASVDNRAASVRDDLEANALVLRRGPECVLLVSCDVVALDGSFVARACEAMAEATGLAPRTIILTGTHTHAGPSVIPTNPLKPVDTAYLDRLQGWLVELADEAVRNVKPARIGWGLGRARIGYNRRCCWADGTHTMHWQHGRDDFTGLEGPDDPSHLALFAAGADNKLIAGVHNNASHPTCFYGRDFYSADFPGAARRYLREELGPIPVLYLNGAFGDLSIENQLMRGQRRESPDQKVARAGHAVVGETLRLLHEATWSDEPALAHVFEDLELTVRLPDPDRVAWARDVLARADAGQEIGRWDHMLAYGVCTLQDEFGGNPVDTVPVHAIRVGDVGLATQPCELYCQFGLDIKRRSPAPVTMIAELADGFSGYCPTIYGIMGGGYSGQAIYWTRLEPFAGYKLVDVSAKLLHQVWKG